MIKIYNETKTPWNITSQGTALLLTKTRQYINNGNKKRRTIKAISYKNLIPQDKVKELTQMVNMKSPQVLFDNTTEVKFSRKDLTAILTTSNKRNKDIYLISLNLQGREVVGVSDCLVLEYLMLGGEFSFIIAVRPDTKFKIYLNNKETNRTEIYVFSSDKEGKTTLRINSKEKDTKDTKPKASFKLKKFRPATATHLILGHESNEEKMLSYTKNDISTFNDTDLHEVVNGLVAKKYKAVTLYDVDNEVVEFAKTKFNTVYAIDCLGNLYKLKI